jgi:hypothetical protein
MTKKSQNFNQTMSVTTDEVLSVIRKIRHDKEFSEFQSNHETMQRLVELERQLSTPKKVLHGNYQFLYPSKNTN